jgi:hypothetical protein
MVICQKETTQQKREGKEKRNVQLVIFKKGKKGM